MYHIFPFFLSADGFFVVFIWFLSLFGWKYVKVVFLHGMGLVPPRVPGRHFWRVTCSGGWSLWMGIKQCGQCLSVVHICVSVSSCISFPCPVFRCLSVCVSLSPLVLSVSHRLALLTGEWVVCWAWAFSGTGANSKQKTVKGDKKIKCCNYEISSTCLKMWYPCIFCPFMTRFCCYCMIIWSY